MSEQNKHLFQDVVLVLISIIFAFFIVRSGLVSLCVDVLGDVKWLGILIAGLFFTSIITTAPAIVLLGAFAETNTLLELVVFGGIGAVIGDYVIFRFIRDRMSKDFEYLFSFSKKRRLYDIFNTHLFRFFIPFIGALIIASPLPDEIGIAMLGMSKVKGRIFFLLSFIANSAGILVIGLVARSLLGV